PSITRAPRRAVVWASASVGAVMTSAKDIPISEQIRLMPRIAKSSHLGFRGNGGVLAEQRDELAPPHGADPKAKDHETKYSRCWRGSVACVAIKSGPFARWVSSLITL